MRLFIKVSGNACDDHNLTSIVWKKKRFYNLCFISLYKYRMKAINWFMNHSLGILSSETIFVLHLVHFMTNFELQLQKVTKFFCYLQLVRMNSSEKTVPGILNYFFAFWDIGQYYIFVSFEIGTKNRKFLIT